MLHDCGGLETEYKKNKVALLKACDLFRVNPWVLPFKEETNNMINFLNRKSVAK